MRGHVVSAARRRGKFLWLETEDGPELGLHLGMSGHFLADPAASTRWDRFTLQFEDGGRLVLRDKRRLGRALLNPDFAHVGPDAAEVSRVQFRTLIGRSRVAIKARLLDQGAISGVGNLLADETLWQARISPQRPASSLSVDELDTLRRRLRAAIRSAITQGGVHTGRFVRARGREGRCPRDGRALDRATIGGRTTYSCPACQL